MLSLTPEQQAVVAHHSGHARVIAVAGAGKTSTLTHFVMARLNAGVAPRRILVLMYNKAAQEDFQRRLSSLSSGQEPGNGQHQALPQVRTFHSLGLKIYDSLIRMGALPQWQGKILSDGEAEGAVWRLLQEIADDDTRQDILSQRRKWVEPAMAFIDLVKAGLLPAADVLESLDYPPECRIYTELFYRFEDWRKAQQRISYADMIYDPVMCLRAHPELADHFGGHMQWILVDEYQDINDIQQALLHTLWGGRGSVMVIGDPDQTIYEFRGSKPEFIVSRFAQEFGDITTYHLPHTFRYGHALSLSANHLIYHNRDREAVTGLSHQSTPDTRVKLHHVRNEAAFSMKLIRDALERDSEMNIAIIHRIWALSAPLELGLLKENIPYRFDHSRSVLEAWELRIFWLLLEISSGRFASRSERNREDCWLHILTTPFPKVRRALLEQIARRMAGVTSGYGEALMTSLPDDISKWQKQQIEVRAQILSQAELTNPKGWRLLKDYTDLTELEEGIRDNAFSAQQSDDRIQTIRAFLSYTRSTDLSASELSEHWRELLQRVKEQKANTGQRVTLTSAHKSKGREWDMVIVPGLNGQYFPYHPEGEFTTPADVSSERRLLYVSMTRARQQLHLLAPETPDKPARECAERELASVFERELGVRRVDDILHTAEQLKAPETAQPVSELVLRSGDGAVPQWLPDYLAHLAPEFPGIDLLPVRFEGPVPGVSNQPRGDIRPGGIIDRKYSDTQSLRRIQHETLGEGVLLSEDSDYLKVRFDSDKKVRTLARKAITDKIRLL